MELHELHGLGKARLEALQKAGVRTLADLLLTLPSGYQDTSVITPLADALSGQTLCVCGYLKKRPRVARFRGMVSATATFRDDTGTLPITWFNMPWVESQYDAETEYILYGRLDCDKQGKLRMVNPQKVTEQGLIPVYRSLGGIPAKTLRDIMRQALTQLEDCCPETLPPALRLRHHLCERNFALRQAHFPESQANLQIALRRIAFEGLLMYQAAMTLLRGERTLGVAINAGSSAQDAYWATLPFAPTGAQRRVLQDICADMRAPHAMSRIVQGDVGSGKTAVAFGAMALTVQAGYQSALMAPTEILARQHFESAQKTLMPLGITCGLLTGGMKAKERRAAIAAVASGAWQAVIGTHALISEDVIYQKLGLVVTDEQHRFGVRQRQQLHKKAEEAPNTLVMSATPIPRTLALVLYGDLDVSVIDELPPGRTPVATRMVPDGKREGMYGFILSEVQKGRQAYIVCPLVEESEAIDAVSAQDMYADLCQGALKSLRLGLTFGAQDALEKARVLSDFSAGQIDVLVATTVIEVGVNVPNATVMVIENAERFGLSQLHQLRGRVGRGAEKSWCFLMAEPNERLKLMTQTQDGFLVAQKDLELRGAGEFFGTRQHGKTTLQGLGGEDMLLLEETQKAVRALREDTSLAGEAEQVFRAAGEGFAKKYGEAALN